MAYFGGIFFANMGGGGGQNYFHTRRVQRYKKSYISGGILLVLSGYASDLLVLWDLIGYQGGMFGLSLRSAERGLF